MQESLRAVHSSYAWIVCRPKELGDVVLNLFSVLNVKPSVNVKPSQQEIQIHLIYFLNAHSCHKMHHIMEVKWVLGFMLTLSRVDWVITTIYKLQFP